MSALAKLVAPKTWDFLRDDKPAGTPWHASSLAQAALVGAVAGLVGTMMLHVSGAV